MIGRAYFVGSRRLKNDRKPLFTVLWNLRVKSTQFLGNFNNNPNKTGPILQFRFLTSPFHKVGFAAFWMADTMGAFTSVLLDFEYSICIYTYGKTLFLTKAASGPPGKKCLEFCECNSPLSYVRPFVRFLPPLIRIIQCLRRYRDSKKKPHLYNTIKYIVGSCTILLTSLTAYYECKHLH